MVQQTALKENLRNLFDGPLDLFFLVLILELPLTSDIHYSYTLQHSDIFTGLSILEEAYGRALAM